MDKSKQVVISEYGFISHKKGARYETGYSSYVPEEVFERVKKYALDERNGAFDKLSLSVRNGYGEIIVAKNYVGVIQTSDGTSIEILPKIRKTSGDEVTRRVFLRMLKSLRDSPFATMGEAELKRSNFPIMEIFISIFSKQASDLVKKGIRMGYREERRNERFLRGKLLVSENIRKNSHDASRFFTAKDEFVPDTPENRLLKSTVSLLLKKSSDNSNLRRLRSLRFALDYVPESTEVQNDLRLAKGLDRLAAHYAPCMKWAELFLNGESPVSFHGDHEAKSLLFPMEKLFESYVAKKIRNTKKDWRLRLQDRKHHLVEEHGRAKKFALRPDIVVEELAGGPIILDTKWKTIDENRSDKNYGISQADMYQMYAYAKKYGSKKLYLIYPKTEQFTTNLKPFVYEINEESVELNVVCFDLEKDEITL